jgi:uncharacterized membrane protein (DUF2068 family)
MRESAGARSRRLPRDVWVIVIGIGKMLKTAALLVVGVAAFLLVHHDVAEALRHWVFVLGVAPGGHLVREALAGAGVIGDRQLREIGIVTFVYAALFAVEGTGLLLRRRWGEWVSIVITGSFIPVEIYETAHHPHVGRAVGTLVNIAAVAYLVSRVRKRHEASAEAHTAVG